MPIIRKSALMLLAFALGLSLSFSLALGQGTARQPEAKVQRPLAEILDADGTLRAGPDTQGTFDPTGLRMVSGPGERPRFAPLDPAAADAPRSDERIAAGDECWDGSFGILTPNGTVRAIAVSGSDVYVAGSFSLAAGVPAANIAKWNGSSWSAVGSGTNGAVYVLAVSGTDIYAGGAFTTPFPYIAKFNTSLGFWQPLGSGVSASVYAITATAGGIYVGGYFTDAGGVAAADRIAFWNGSAWSALGSGLNSGVQAIALIGTDVYAGGYFTNAGGVAAADYIAKWSGSAWSALGSGMNAAVLSLAASGTSVYAGGNFTQAGGASANYIARWNGSNWYALGSGLDGVPYTLAAKGSDIYVGGLFGQAGGLTALCIAKYNGSAWSVLGSGVDNQVYAITPSERNVFVGGNFQNTGGKTSHYFGRWIEPLSVVSPNGGEVWDAGTSKSITWSADASVGPVKIEYTLDGLNWGTVIASTPNTGSYSWTVPANLSTVCRVRISEAADGDPVDASDGTFTIAGFTVTSPVAADRWTVGTQRTINWTTVGTFPNVRIDLSTDNGSSWGTITASTANTGSFVWTVAGAVSSWVIIRVSDAADGSPYDHSHTFSIYPVLALTLTSPNGGETWDAASAHAITWAGDAAIGPLRIEYSRDGGALWALVAASAPNTGSYGWTVPAAASPSCLVRIFEAYDGEPLDASDAVFTITGLRVSSPNGGEYWTGGSSHPITWDTQGACPAVRIEFSSDNGGAWETIAANTANTGSFPWTVPTLSSSSCRIRVSDATDGAPSDLSDDVFAIYAPPAICVVSPNGGESWLAGSTHEITWTSSGIGSLVMIEYSTDNGASYSFIAPMTPNDGSYSWVLPGTLSSQYLVRITDRNELTDDTSDAVFAVVGAQTITVTSPNGGESWAVGSSHEITWTQEGLSGSTVTINLRKDDSQYRQLGAVDASLNTFSWEIPADETQGSDYQINLDASGGISDDSDGYFSIAADVIRKDDFVGTWDGQGVYYRNSDTAAWAKMASPATKIAVGDLDGDGIDDLIGLWPGQGGIWVNYSQAGAWAKLSSTAQYIAAGDMNGDGRVDLVGTWDGQGVFYKNSISGAWVKLASPATMVTAGDIDNDGTDDLIGLWPSQGGIWAKYSQTGAWAKLSSTAVHIASGDMNGDKRDDLLGTWDGQGVFYRDSATGAWVKMASPATLITTGDIDGDEIDDLIGIWPTQGGVWVKYSSDGTWERLSSTARDIAAGKMRAASGGGEEQAEDILAARPEVVELPFPIGGIEEGPGLTSARKDFSDLGPGGARFVYLEDISLEPKEDESVRLNRVPGPSEPGAKWVEQGSIFPQETPRKEKRAEAGVKIKKLS